MGYQVAGPHGSDDVADGVQDQLRLLVLDVVAALGGDHQPAAGDQLGQLALQLLPQPLDLLTRPARRRRVDPAVCEHHQRHRPQRGALQRHPGLAFAGPDVDPLGVHQPVRRGHRLPA